MGERSYRPGSRRPDLQKTVGQFSPSRWAWTKNNIGQFVILVDEPEEGSYQSGRTVRLYHPIPKRPAISFDLTNLTEEELAALKDLFDSAFEWALPIVKQRDKEAQDAFNRGDDSHSRIYRQVPQLVYRKRPESAHSEGVLHGPEDVPAVGGRETSSEEGDDEHGSLRNSGDGLVEQHEGASSSQDDEPSVDESQSVRPMVGPPRPPAGVLPPLPRQGNTPPPPRAPGGTGTDAGGS